MRASFAFVSRFLLDTGLVDRRERCRRTSQPSKHMHESQDIPRRAVAPPHTPTTPPQALTSLGAGALRLVLASAPACRPSGLLRRPLPSSRFPSSAPLATPWAGPAAPAAPGLLLVTPALRAAAACGETCPPPVPPHSRHTPEPHTQQKPRHILLDPHAHTPTQPVTNTGSPVSPPINHRHRWFSPFPRAPSRRVARPPVGAFCRPPSAPRPPSGTRRQTHDNPPPPPTNQPTSTHWSNKTLPTTTHTPHHHTSTSSAYPLHTAPRHYSHNPRASASSTAGHPPPDLTSLFSARTQTQISQQKDSGRTPPYTTDPPPATPRDIGPPRALDSRSFAARAHSFAGNIRAPLPGILRPKPQNVHPPTRPSTLTAPSSPLPAAHTTRDLKPTTLSDSQAPHQVSRSNTRTF